MLVHRDTNAFMTFSFTYKVSDETLPDVIILALKHVVDYRNVQYN